jgi:hypothetical protein
MVAVYAIVAGLGEIVVGLTAFTQAIWMRVSSPTSAMP